MYQVFISTWKSLPGFTEFLDAFTEFFPSLPSCVKHIEGFT